MIETYLDHFKEAITYQLNELEYQIPLTYKDISCPIRQDLGRNIDLVYMRIFRIALRDTYGSKLSNSLLYHSGKSMAHNNFNISSIEQLVNHLEELMLGKITISYQDHKKIIFDEDECAVCSGMPNIGEVLCSFEAGFIAGGLSTILNKDVKVIETKCWGLDDKICRFEADLNPAETMDDDLNIDTIDLIATLASKASIAIELNKELKYKNDIF